MSGSHGYYTGIIFRGYTYGSGDAIVKGGRYDNLLEKFGKEKILLSVNNVDFIFKHKLPPRFYEYSVARNLA